MNRYTGRILALTVSLLFLHSNIAFGQNFCQTRSDIPDMLSKIPTSQLIVSSTANVVRIAVHVMRRSDGSGGLTQGEVTTAINFLVTDYETRNICISRKIIDEVKNDTFYNFTSFSGDGNGDGKFDNFSPNSNADAIDIYLYPNDKLNSGLASGIPGTAFVLGGFINGQKLVGSSVMSHEMGHCLGLYHTFHGNPCESVPGSCRELVNGSNCTVCGDFVCDTPADNQQFNNNANDCGWNGIACSGITTDANGQRYVPNMNLIMAYTLPSCMNTLTQGQGDRIRAMIANSSLLRNVIVPNDVTVSNRTVSPNTSALYDALNTLQITGTSSVESAGTLTARAGVSITLAPGFAARSGSSFQALINTACSTVDINNNVRIAEAEVKKANREPQEAEESETYTLTPNPASTATRIRYYLKESTIVNLVISDLSGRKVATLVSQYQESGWQEVEYNIGNLPDGIYLSALQTATDRQTRRLVVIR
jgi:hypothetical protein